MYCNNCGKKGHVFKLCNNPITSCGLILINSSKLPIDKPLEVLMVRRKDSMAYTEFLRGKYDINDEEYIQKLLSNMTSSEQQNILTKTFKDLWVSHWGEDSEKQTNEYEKSSEKFSKLDFKKLLNGIQSFDESEWGFPKGRRAHRESDLDCAIREFWEETDIPRDCYTICSNLILKETFDGTNGVSYTHIYFVALLNEKIINIEKDMSSSQKREISAISWKTLEQCRSLTRPHYTERSNLINSLHRIVNTFNTQESLFLNKNE
jgi:8-oxo-dGTP pyrophosphatase MutT (NUDIX family)